MNGSYKLFVDCDVVNKLSDQGQLSTEILVQTGLPPSYAARRGALKKRVMGDTPATLFSYTLILLSGYRDRNHAFIRFG